MLENNYIRNKVTNGQWTQKAWTVDAKSMDSGRKVMDSGRKVMDSGRKAKKFPCYDGKNYAIFFFKYYIRESGFLDPLSYLLSFKRRQTITTRTLGRKKNLSMRSLYKGGSYERKKY